MRQKNIWLFIVLLFLLIVYLLYKPQTQNIHPQIIPSATKTIIPTVSQNLHAIYPNPTLTPGDIFPDATAEIICVSGYTKTVRNVPVEEKRKVYEEYGLSYPQPKGAYEADHFIPLELGGSNDIKNLWSEPAEPRPGFHEKDIVENYLHDQVCHGKKSLEEAQNVIKADWYTVYKQIKNPQSYIWE